MNLKAGHLLKLENRVYLGVFWKLRSLKGGQGDREGVRNMFSCTVKVDASPQ